MQWRYRHTVLVFAVSTNFGQMGSRLAISPVVPDIIEAFGSSKSVLGLALTGMWVGYAVAQLPSGVLAERYGERRLMLAALGAIVLGSGALSASPSIVTFAVFAIVLGIGAGLFFTPMVTWVTRTVGRPGQALGVVTGAGAFAGLVVPVVAAFVGARFGWRVAVLLGAVLAAPILVFAVRSIRETPPVRPDESPFDRVSVSLLVDVLSVRRVAVTTVFATVGAFAFQSVASFYPTYLHEFQGLTIEQAGIAFGAVFATSAVAQPVGGRFSDRVGLDPVITTVMAVAAFGLALTVWLEGFVALVAASVVLGTGMSWFPVMVNRFMQVLPETERGLGFGLVRSVYMTVGALGSVVTGSLADAFGWPVAFGFIAVLLVAMVVLLVVNARAGGGL